MVYRQVKTVAVLGGHFNAYTLLRSLEFLSLTKIVVADSRSIIKGSKLYNEFYDSDNRNDLKDVIDHCTQRYGDIYVIPTADWHLEELIKINNSRVFFFAQSSFFPELNQKMFQYSVAQKAGINCPVTQIFKCSAELCLEEGKFYVIKPNHRDLSEQKSDHYFRTLIVSDENKQDVEKYSDGDKSFICSEIIEADASDVWSTLMLVKDGKVIADWTGRKLAQSPWHFGVFASARTEKNDDVRRLSLKLARAFNYTGIMQPEYKFCKKSNTYYLMEINFRYMMWHYAGTLAGINIPAAEIAYFDNPNSLIKLSDENSTKGRILYFLPLFFKNILKRDFTFKSSLRLTQALFAGTDPLTLNLREPRILWNLLKKSFRSG